MVETENPHHTSIVRVQQGTEESDTYSVKTESGDRINNLTCFKDRSFSISNIILKS